jgi:hypothetical protein
VTREAHWEALAAAADAARRANALVCTEDTPLARRALVAAMNHYAVQLGPIIGCAAASAFRAVWDAFLAAVDRLTASIEEDPHGESLPRLVAATEAALARFQRVQAVADAAIGAAADRRAGELLNDCLGTDATIPTKALWH